MGAANATNAATNYGLAGAANPARKGNLIMMKVFFTSDDVIAGRHLADLGEYGDFRADHILVDPERPDQIQAVGTLMTMPTHMEEPVTIPATLDIDLESPADVVGMAASDLFNAPWESWTTSDIPAEWKY